MKTILEIQNLKCGGCEASIYNKLSTLIYIKDLIIDVEASTISFDYNVGEDLEEVKEILRIIGYPIQGVENKLMTRAKSYVSCAIGRLTK